MSTLIFWILCSVANFVVLAGMCKVFKWEPMPAAAVSSMGLIGGPVASFVIVTMIAVGLWLGLFYLLFKNVFKLKEKT